MIIKKTKIRELPPIVIYILISVFVAVIDTLFVWVMYHILQIELLTSNTIGVIAGSMLHYRLSSKSVFKTQHGPSGFVIYAITFSLGLLLANWLIYIGEYILFVKLNEHIRFFVSKGVSVLLPFFLLYFIRKFLFYYMKKNI